MKALSKLLIMLLVVTMLISSLAACDFLGNKDGEDGGETNLPPLVDYVADFKFNPDSGRKYIETTVKYFIDGDTTHFNVPDSIYETGILKARYLAVDTPESTGQIEPWGKRAAAFTRTKLEGAESIIIESNDGNWNHDSTGERFLVWVWYKTEGASDYRNLNVELLQEGLAKGTGLLEICYSDICKKVQSQAELHELYVYSKAKDDDFYDGDAIPMTLKELKMNISAYENMRVAIEGVVARKYDDTTVYVEEYDEETGAYFGIQAYYGYNLNSLGVAILEVGNRVRIAGSVQYYENGGTWQITDIKYDPYNKESSENIKKISSGHSAAYPELDAATILSGKLNFEVTEKDENGEEKLVDKEFDYGYIAMHSTARLKNLTIKSVYTTKTGGSKGAMSITCEDENGTTIVVRTIVLIDLETKETVTDERFPTGAVIDVKGVIDFFDGEYQLKLYSMKDVTFH